ncbi:MAG: hypothetical protein KA792_02900 [Bacteroidales bacterium]|nr:hypothetical protein [Bacteroidales bacterium]
MKLLKRIILILLIFIGVLLISMWYLGFFTNINIEKREAGGFIVAGIDYTGKYSEVNKPMMEVDKKLRDMQVACTKGFGIYYDDPKDKPENKCRSFVGNIIEEKDYNRLEDISKAGLKTDSIALLSSLYAEFPIKSKFSYFMGPMKIYPKFKKIIEEEKLKPLLSIEVYDIPNKKIYFIFQYTKD